MFVVRADGTVISRSQDRLFGVRWDEETHSWRTGGFMSTELLPGDTILIPRKMVEIEWLKEAKDITQILYQIAVTAGVVFAAMP